MFSFLIEGKAQVGFPYCEKFTDNSTQSATVFGGNARIVNGALRLTDAVNEQNGYIYIDIPFSSTYGIKAEFEYFSYGGNGAEGRDGTVAAATAAVFPARFAQATTVKPCAQNGSEALKLPTTTAGSTLNLVSLAGIQAELFMCTFVSETTTVTKSFHNCAFQIALQNKFAPHTANTPAGAFRTLH